MQVWFAVFLLVGPQVRRFAFYPCPSTMCNLFKYRWFVFQMKDDRQVMADFNPDDKTRFVFMFVVKYSFSRLLVKVKLNVV